MERLKGRAQDVLRTLPPASFDLVFTSPPAYPSRRQPIGALGREESLDAYAQTLGRFCLQARRILKPDGYLVLVLEPLPGFNVLKPLARVLKRLMPPPLGTWHWNHGTGASWVVILPGTGSPRLNRNAEAWQSGEWAIPRPPPDPTYGFYEWPDGLVQAVLSMTIPNGGRIIDPFAGKALALSRLGSAYEVVAVDVLELDDEDSSANKDRLAAVAHPLHGRPKPVDGQVN